MVVYLQWSPVYGPVGDVYSNDPWEIIGMLYEDMAIAEGFLAFLLGVEDECLFVAQKDMA